MEVHSRRVEVQPATGDTGCISTQMRGSSWSGSVGVRSLVSSEGPALSTPVGGVVGAGYQGVVNRSDPTDGAGQAWLMVCASPTRWPRRASSESRNSGPPRRPSTITSLVDAGAGAEQTLRRRRPRAGRPGPIAIELQRRRGARRWRGPRSRPGATRAAQSARNVTGSRSISRSSAVGGLGGQLLDDLEVEEEVAAGGVPADPQHPDAVEGVAGRDDGVGHRAGVHLEQHVVDRGAVGRFSTISIASMSPPASPIALATRPSDPGTSGSSTRSRNGMHSRLRRLADVLPVPRASGRRGAVGSCRHGPARRCRRPVARWAWRSTAARTAASAPTTRTCSWARVTAV